MAEDSKPSRRIRKVETVRERAEKANVGPKPRRIRQVTAGAGEGLKSAGSKVRREYHPIKLPDNKLGRFLTKSRRIIPSFFHEAWAELKQVSWPNRRDTAKFTLAVLVFAFLFGSIIAIVDYGLERLFKSLLNL